MTPTTHRAAGPSLREALSAWARVALLSFGGPAGQISVMHRILVEEKRWIGERRFLHALNFCMLLPGPEAQQLATYLGWLLHGWRGGLAAGALFVLPGFVAILLLSVAYGALQGTRGLEVAFFGIKAAVIAVVVDALVRIGARALRHRAQVIVAITAFLAMAVFEVPFAIILLATAACGPLLVRAGDLAAGAAAAEPEAEDHARPPGRASWGRALAIVAGGVACWWLPIGILALTLGPSHVLVRIGVFFGKVALLTFGGAYAVLAYVAHEAVTVFHWLQPHEMLDGLGLAESTPGPLIMVVQFVAYLAAMRDPGGLDPRVAAVAASCVATWVTFVPSFVWIFAGGPFVERLRQMRRLGQALAAVTAAVVGVMAHLALWFANHVLFAAVAEIRHGPIRVSWPDLGTLDPASLAIAAGALFALRRLRWGLLPTLAAACALGVLWKLARP